MLSERARGESASPILLIEEGDVYAGHAASVGRVDPIQLFYLMSRGITQKEAERLIIFGFLAPVVNELPIEAVKKQLVQVIEGKYANGFSLDLPPVPDFGTKCERQAPRLSRQCGDFAKTTFCPEGDGELLPGVQCQCTSWRAYPW